MIYKEDALFWRKSVLESLDYIDHYHSPLLVPVVENNRLHTNIVKYADLYKFAENTNFSLNQALSSIKASHNLNNVSVSIDEAYVYDNPYILNNFSGNVVINPISENTNAYKLCDLCMRLCLETHDENFAEFFMVCTEEECQSILEESKFNSGADVVKSLQNQIDVRQHINDNIGNYFDKNPNERKNNPIGKRLTDEVIRHQKEIDEKQAQIDEINRKRAERAKSKVDNQPKSLSDPQERARRLEEMRKRKALTNPAQTQQQTSTTTSNQQPAQTQQQTSTTTPNQQPAQTQQQTSTTTPNQQPAQIQQANPNGQPSWWSQKWASFTKFLNNLGNSNDAKGEQNSQWFSNIVDKIKGFFSSNPATAQQEAFLIEATRLRKTAFSFGAGRTKSTTNIPQPATGYGPPNNSAISKSSNIQQQPMNEVYRPRRRYRTQYLH